MKAEFIVKAECTYECDEKSSGEVLASYIKGLLQAYGINAKVLIGNLKYDGEGKREVMERERLCKRRAGNSQ